MKSGVIHRDVLALQLPGLFSSWRKLDPAREAMRARFESAFAAAGFTLVGCGGRRARSIPVARRRREIAGRSLRGKRPWVWREDPSWPIVYQAAGGVTPVLTGVPEVPPELSTAT